MAPQASVDAPVVPQATDEFYTSQQILVAAVLAATRRVWSGMTVAGGMDASWQRVGPQLVVLTAAAQLSAAQAGAAYVPAAVSELGLPADVDGDVVPRALVGVASDGRPLDSLLYGAVVRSGQALNAGAAPADALASGRSWLDRAVQVQVADAGRVASGVSIAAHPKVTGWVRMLRPPSCARCALLAGRFYRWSTGFQRHPHCDCRMIPANEAIAGDLTTDPNAYFHSLDPTQQDKVFTKAGAQAIRDGADIGQVVNARRGMSYAGQTKTRVNAQGRTVNVTRRVGSATTTTEATTKRAAGGAREPRLMPEAIYKQAGGNRAEALRLLRSNGYLE